jgi:predicted dienelactone hydrolase
MKKFLFIVLTLGFLHSCKELPKSFFNKPKVEHIGVRTLEYQDANRSRPVVVEFWYPTDESGPIDQSQDKAWVHPKEVRGVKIKENLHPLIVMSHGNKGERRDSSWLADRLVKKGYVVASVEHYGNSYATYDTGTSLCFWERSRDISFVLDSLFQDPALEGKIDPNRIGFIGYSLGGMTGLSLAGAQAQKVDEVARQLQKIRQEISSELLESADFSAAYQDFYEKRIKAVALIFPATFVYPPEGLKAIRTPVAMIASEGDEILPFNDHAMKLIQHKALAKFKVIKDKISHYVPLNHVSEEGKHMICEDVHTDKVEADRCKFHEEIDRFVSEFFQENL